MSGTYYSKALLLEEREIETQLGCEIKCFDDLYDGAMEYAEYMIGSPEYPWASFLGCSSERFNVTEIRCEDQRCLWLRDQGTWTETLGEIIKTMSGLDPQLFNICTGAGYDHKRDRKKLIAAVSAHAAASIDEGRFACVRHMMTALENFEKAGLPCFREMYYLTAGGEDEAHDFRERDWGAGRRVLVEMAYVWE